MYVLDVLVGFTRFARIPLIITSIFGNTAVVIVLLGYKSLRRNSSNMLIAQLGFADFVLGIGLLIRGIQTEVYLATNVQILNRYVCMLYGSMTILGMNLMQATIIMITLDRLFVIVFPIFYRQHVGSTRLSIVRFIVGIVTSLISFGGQFIDFPFQTDVTICSSGATWSDGYRFYFMIFSASASMLTIVLNVGIIAIYRLRKQLSTNRKENALVIAQTAIIVSYTIFWCVPTIVYLMAMIIGYQATVFGSITLVLSIGSGFFASLNPFLFLWKHIEFRKFFVSFYRLEKIFERKSITAIVNIPPNTAVESISHK
ncbi:hypothetical protein Tcan_09829 [Toxocara canis]|uniref:G-protein coupled receptors family 1 profile domain-containing protein n=1 Tax=Toxocara canis TaxID=6265 RepID=A0A0B2VGW1_TOXCA|nr:hypothetical protein Tcan_09829 [Toxocara canis]